MCNVTPLDTHMLSIIVLIRLCHTIVLSGCVNARFLVMLTYGVISGGTRDIDETDLPSTTYMLDPQ